MDNVKQQNDWLNKELQERIHELMTSRKEKVSYTFQITTTTLSVFGQHNKFFESLQVMLDSPKGEFK